MLAYDTVGVVGESLLVFSASLVPPQKVSSVCVLQLTYLSLASCKGYHTQTEDSEKTSNYMIIIQYTNSVYTPV